MATSDIKKGPLYVDSTSNSVGIGGSPNAILDVQAGAGADVLDRPVRSSKSRVPPANIVSSVFAPVVFVSPVSIPPDKEDSA